MLRPPFSKFSTAVSSALIGCFLLVESVWAQIKNPVTGNLGNDADKASRGETFLGYFVMLWRTTMTIGAIIVIVQFIWGAVDWISSGGDKGKIESARNKITQAIIGLIILVSSFTILGYVGQIAFGNQFSILKLTFPTPD